MNVVVIGAGVGGLCAAIRLAVAGHDVTVYERNRASGGKLARLTEAGYTFDLGPTVLTLPEVFDEVFELAGTSLRFQCELVRLDPQCRYRWVDGSTLDVFDDRDRTDLAVGDFAPDDVDRWQQVDHHAGQIWDVLERFFMAGPISGRRTGVTSRDPVDLERIDGKRTLASFASTYLDDPRLRQVVGRAASVTGSSPYQVPATLAALGYVGRESGWWHIRGGIATLADRLASVAKRVGVDLRTGVDVGRIETGRGRVTGVTLADGGTIAADAVVSNVDAAHLYGDLLTDRKRVKAIAKDGRSFSAFVMCAAVRGRTEAIAHHNVFFSLDDQQEFKDLTAGRVALDPTISVCVSSVTDPTMAPRDGENWVFHVDVPAATGLDRKLMSAAVLNRLAERGVDLRERIDFTRTLVPADFEARYRAIDGALHGTSSNGRTATFRRPANVGPVDGLFLVGGSTHPGAGLARTAISARIVADLVGT